MRRRYYKICLTGGPCAGKTVGFFIKYDFYKLFLIYYQVQHFYKKNLEKEVLMSLLFLYLIILFHFYELFIYRELYKKKEAATTIGTGGGMLNLSSYSEDDIIKF